MLKHITIKLTILLILLLLLAFAAPIALAQSAAGKSAPKSVPQATIPADPNMGSAFGEASQHFKIQPPPKKSNEVDLGKVIMKPTDPNKTYIDPRLKLLWFRRDHPAMALDFKIK